MYTLMYEYLMYYTFGSEGLLSKWNFVVFSFFSPFLRNELEVGAQIRRQEEGARSSGALLLENSLKSARKARPNGI